MQLFKQLITKQYQKYLQHEFNNRVFPEEFYHSWVMASVILEAEGVLTIDQAHIHELNKAYTRLRKSKMQEAINKSPAEPDKEESKKEWKAQRQLLLSSLQQQGSIELQQRIVQDSQNITLFFKQYQHVVIQEEPQKFRVDIPGVIGIITPFLTYEKQTTRR